jgi:hypothetical protein
VIATEDQWRIHRVCRVCTGIPCDSGNFKYMYTYLGVKKKHTRQTVKAQPSSNSVLEQAGRVYVSPCGHEGHATYAMCDGGRKDSRTDGITRDSDRIFNTPFTRPRLAVCRVAVTIQIEAALTCHQITKRPCPVIPVAFQSFECRTGRRHLVEFVITIVKVRFNYSLALKKSCVV